MYPIATVDERKNSIIKNSKEYIDQQIAENDDYHKNQKVKVKNQLNDYSTEALKGAHNAYRENEIDYMVTLREVEDSMAQLGLANSGFRTKMLNRVKQTAAHNRLAIENGQSEIKESLTEQADALLSEIESSRVAVNKEINEYYDKAAEEMATESYNQDVAAFKKAEADKKAAEQAILNSVDKTKLRGFTYSLDTKEQYSLRTNGKNVDVGYLNYIERAIKKASPNLSDNEIVWLMQHYGLVQSLVPITKIEIKDSSRPETRLERYNRLKWERMPGGFTSPNADISAVESLASDYESFFNKAKTDFSGLTGDNIEQKSKEYSLGANSLLKRAYGLLEQFDLSKKFLNADEQSLYDYLSRVIDSLNDTSYAFRVRERNYKNSPEYIGKQSKDILHRYGRAADIEEALEKINAQMAEQKKIIDDIDLLYNEAFEAAEKNGYRDIYSNDMIFAQEKKMNEGTDASNKYVQLSNQKRTLEEELTGVLGEFSSAAELLAAYEKKKQEKEAAEEAQEWSVYLNADDFEQNSAYTEKFSDDEVYQYINGKNLKENFKFEKQGFGNLTETEIAIYNYKYKTEGFRSAEYFLESIQERIRYRRAEERYESLEGNTFKENLFAIEAGWEQFTQNMDAFLWGETDISSTQYLSGMVREDLSDEGLKYYNLADGEWQTVKVFGASTAQVRYDLTSTITTMAPSILTSVALNLVAPGLGTAAGAVVMGASAYGGAYSEVVNLGYNDTQARIYATLVGLAEGSLQYVLGGIGALGGTKSLSAAIGKIDNVFARVALSGAAEGLEEGLQTAIEPWLKRIAGMDFKAADIEDVLYSSLLGFLIGIKFSAAEAAAQISSYLNTQKYFNNSAAVKKLIAEGLEMPEGSNVRKLADTYSKKFNNGSTPTKSEVSQYVAALKDHVKTEYAVKAEKTAHIELTKKGETLDVGKLSGIIKKAVAGQAVTPAEAKYLHQSSHAEKLLQVISMQVDESALMVDQYTKSKLSVGKNQTTPETVDPLAYEKRIIEYIREMDGKKSKKSETKNDFRQNNLDSAVHDGYNENAGTAENNQQPEAPESSLTDDQKQKLKEENGWSDEVVNSIRSIKEAEIYQNAGLKEKVINGKKYLIRDDIEFKLSDESSLTNRELMKKGYAPLTKTGESIELHHIGQRQDSPLAELTMAEHRGKGNYPILHNKKKKSEINRAEFDKERKQYWKGRLENISN